MLIQLKVMIMKLEITGIKICIIVDIMVKYDREQLNRLSTKGVAFGLLFTHIVITYDINQSLYKPSI